MNTPNHEYRKKTTTAQFEVMLDYMETHGDISKQLDSGANNWRNTKHWHDLCKALNEAGTAKTIMQWRRVWSDLKAYSKKKLIRIHQNVNGHGGHRIYKRLTNIERRALAVVDAAIAISHDVKDEVPISQMDPIEDIEVIKFPCSFDVSTGDTNHDEMREPSPDSDFVNDSEARDETCTESASQKSESQQKANKILTFPSNHMYSQRSDLSRHKTEYEPINYEMDNKNMIRLKELELNQETQLKEMEFQHQIRLQEMELQQQSELRELELRQQGRWQELFSEFLSIINKVADKYASTNR